MKFKDIQKLSDVKFRRLTGVSWATFNLMLATFSGNAPVGLLAYLAASRSGMRVSPRIAIKNDLLYLALDGKTATVFRNAITVAKLPLDLSAITWQTQVATTTANDYSLPTAITVDDSGNVIVAGSLYTSFSGLTVPYLLKVNSSGTFQWHRYINQSGTFNAVTTDASDAVYPVGTGRYIFSTRDDILVSKYDASGTRQFLRVLGTTTESSNNCFGNGVALLNGTDYCVASRVTPSSFDGCLWTLAQVDGAKVAATFQNDASNLGQDGVAVIRGESADVLYYLVNTFATGSISSKGTQVLLKFTTAGGFVWQSFLTVPFTLTAVGTALCMDPSNTHVYVVGITTNAGATRTEVLINKWTTGGSLVWQRSITSPTQNLTNPRIAVDSFDNIYVSFLSDPHVNGLRGLVLKMPGDGAGSGNFATIDGFRYDYVTTSLTTPADALTISTNSRGTQADTSAAVTPGNTITAGVMTLAVVPF
jgi:hypothetical protein